MKKLRDLIERRSYGYVFSIDFTQMVLQQIYSESEDSLLIPSKLETQHVIELGFAHVRSQTRLSLAYCVFSGFLGLERAFYLSPYHLLCSVTQ